MEYEPFEPGIEVNGQTVFSVVDGFGTFRRLAERFLVEEGIGAFDASRAFAIQLDGWYPQEAWLRAFRRIGQEVGQAVLYDIGRRIPANAKFPPTVVDVPTAVASIDVAYHMNHRKKGRVMFDPASGRMLEGIGHYGYELDRGSRVVRSRCENPYPCSFDNGIVAAMAHRFDVRAAVEHEQGECRRKGDNACVYRVRYGL